MCTEHSGRMVDNWTWKCEIFPERGSEYVAKQECPEYFADMFRPSGALGGSGHKQIRGSGWQKLWPMADMALAPEITAPTPGGIVTRGHLLWGEPGNWKLNRWELGGASIYEAFVGEFWTRVQYWIEGLDFSKKNLTVWSASFGNPQNEISLSFHVFIGSN